MSSIEQSKVCGNRRRCRKNQSVPVSMFAKGGRSSLLSSLSPLLLFLDFFLLTFLCCSCCCFLFYSFFFVSYRLHLFLEQVILKHVLKHDFLPTMNVFLLLVCTIVRSFNGSVCSLAGQERMNPVKRVARVEERKRKRRKRSNNSINTQNLTRTNMGVWCGNGTTLKQEIINTTNKKF